MQPLTPRSIMVTVADEPPSVWERAQTETTPVGVLLAMESSLSWSNERHRNLFRFWAPIRLERFETPAKIMSPESRRTAGTLLVIPSAAFFSLF